MWLLIVVTELPGRPVDKVRTGAKALGITVPLILQAFADEAVE